VGGGGGAREMQSKSQQRAVVTAGRDARTGGVGSTRRGRGRFGRWICSQRWIGGSRLRRLLLDDGISSQKKNRGKVV
jgi:hypothetical protein